MKLDAKKFPTLQKILASDPAGVNDELKAFKNIKALLQDFFSLGDPVSPDQMGILTQLGDIANHYANKGSEYAVKSGGGGEKPLHCDMKKDCQESVTHMDNKGFVYCTQHGEQRKGSVPTRKLSPAELEQLKSGKPLEKY